VTPDVQNYNVMINGLCKNKMVNEAVNLFKEMHLKNMSPNTITFNSLIDGLCKSGEISNVWDLIDEMHDRGQPANIITYNSLFDGLCKNHQVDKAIALLKKSKTRELNQICTHTYYLSMDKNGRLEDAQEVYRDLTIKGYHLNARMYTVMISGLCKEGFFDEALSLLSKMEDNGCTIDGVTCENIIRALFESDKNDKAVKHLREMIARGLL
jgi:pentatricopeptide repeat domain-containing protein 1